MNSVLIDNFVEISNINLFNTVRYHKLHQKQERNVYLSLVNESNATLAVARFLEKEPGHFVSPWRGTFGSFESVSDLSLQEMEDFVLKTESYLKEHGASKITLALPPLIYKPSQTALWMNILLRRGFIISGHELNYSMDVVGSFVDKLDRGNRKRLSKCATQGLSFCILEGSEYQDAYNVLEENRAKRGRKLSISWDSLDEMSQKLPHDIIMFGVHQKGRLIASALCLLVNLESLYVFYWGEVSGVENLSPVTFLANGIYKFCLEDHIKILDIGTSTLNGEPNHGLIRYKKNLGCYESLKLTMTKNL